MSFQRDLGVNLAGVEVILRLFDQLAEVHHRVGGLAEDIRDAMEPTSPLGTISMSDAPRRRPDERTCRSTGRTPAQLAESDHRAAARRRGSGSARPSPRCWGPRWSRWRAIGGLVIWHLVRRGRLIRERQGPPRIVRMPELPDLTGDLHDEDDGGSDRMSGSRSPGRSAGPSTAVAGSPTAS